MQISLFEDVDKYQNSKQNCYISETAMGKKIYAQSNHDSEYVRSVYRQVLFTFISVNMAGTFLWWIAFFSKSRLF